MTDILQRICADTRADVEKAKTLKPMEIAHREALRAPPPREFIRALRAKSENEEIAVIPEIKKASPSSGIIRSHYCPADLAKELENAGAACLSVVTDGNYFQGSPKDLAEARAACNLPILRNDFILDVWQIAESRAMGADCILLILGALDDESAVALHQTAVDYGMNVIVEVCDRDELARALKLSSRIISVVNRNRKTLKLDMMNAAEIIRMAPLERFMVSAGGFESADEIKFMKEAGARGFVVGESLLKQNDVGVALKKLANKPY